MTCISVDIREVGGSPAVSVLVQAEACVVVRVVGGCSVSVTELPVQPAILAVQPDGVSLVSSIVCSLAKFVSCYGNGRWLNALPWLNGEKWKNY